MYNSILLKKQMKSFIGLLESLSFFFSFCHSYALFECFTALLYVANKNNLYIVVICWMNVTITILRSCTLQDSFIRHGFHKNFAEISTERV